MPQKSKMIKFIILPVIIPIILTFIWFKSGSIMGGGEEGLYFYKPSNTVRLTTSTWMEYGTGSPNFGASSVNTLFYPLSFLNNKLHIPNFVLQAIVFLFLLETGIISVYFLTSLFLEKNEVTYQTAAVSSIFYLLNPFSISQIWGRSLTSQYFSFALLPLSVLLVVLGFSKKKYIYAFFLVIVSIFFSSAFGIASFTLTYWSVLTLAIIYLFLNSHDRKKDFIFGVTFFALIIFLWSIVNLWWFYEYLPGQNSVTSDRLGSLDANINSLIGVSRNFTPDLIIRLFQASYFSDGGYYGEVYSSFSMQLISWLLPFFLIFGIFKLIKNSKFRRMRFFAMFFLVGLFVSLGANFPSGTLFLWLFKNLFFLEIFRNPYEKFGLVYVLGYAPILSLGFISLFNQKLKIIQGATLFLICGILVWPIWTGKIFAGLGDKIGVSVPYYYQEVNSFLNHNSSHYRVFMTPLWGGDGAAYLWGDKEFHGSDPMIYLIDQPTISNTLQSPYYFDLISSIRRYMDRIDVAPTLSLLRTKYLVDRGDAILATGYEKQHYKFLTDSTHPPNDITDVNRIVCQNLSISSKVGDTPKLGCRIETSQQNWLNIRYLDLEVKTDTPAALDVTVKDKNDSNVRWDGRLVKDYQTTGDWTTVLVPLNVPYEYSYQNPIDLSHIYELDIIAYPKDSAGVDPVSINLKGIHLDEGREVKIKEYNFVNKFGELSVFEPRNFKPSPEFGTILQLRQVENFQQLFQEALKNRGLLDTIAFVLSEQNTQKNLSDLFSKSGVKTEIRTKVSDTKYWIQVEQNSKDRFILLSKTFDSNWKVIQGVRRQDLDGGFLNNIKLLRMMTLPEDRHYVANGYANLWRVSGGNREYAIVFYPQLTADITSQISLFSSIMIIGFTGIWILKNLLRGFRRNRSLDSVKDFNN